MTRRHATLAVLSVLAVLLAAVSMAAGRVWVPLADWLGALLDEHLVNRVVLDLHGVPLLHSALVGQLGTRGQP